jgi:hypothetical protein
MFPVLYTGWIVYLVADTIPLGFDTPPAPSSNLVGKMVADGDE